MLGVSRVSRLLLAVLCVSGCSHLLARPDDSQSHAPAALIGNFDDDYGAHFSLSDSVFFQRPRNRFHIVRWDKQQQFFVARNDSLNGSDANRWTRVDWVMLDAMAPYSWGFCLSVYNATTRAIAESTTVAHRDTPRTGCNGFPFTRMKRPQ